jgi:hypothetical protein
MTCVTSVRNALPDAYWYQSFKTRFTLENYTIIETLSVDYCSLALWLFAGFSSNKSYVGGMCLFHIQAYGFFYLGGGNKYIFHNVEAYTIRKTVCTAHEASLLAACINLQLQYIVQYVTRQPAAR